MIGWLRGKVRGRTDTVVLLDVGGVGYEVHADRQTMLAVGPDGADVALHVRTVVREDAITLFGFADAVARDAFDSLTGVSGVGPKMASGILGGMPLPELVVALRDKDIRKLATLPGVGKKTAERLSLELSDKFVALSIALPATPGGLPSVLADDVRSALANLGFSARDIDTALRALKPGPAPHLEDLVRTAIGLLCSR
jgi:Holliday junction DNA helicase RuvA